MDGRADALAATSLPGRGPPDNAAETPRRSTTQELATGGASTAPYWNQRLLLRGAQPAHSEPVEPGSWFHGWKQPADQAACFAFVRDPCRLPRLPITGPEDRTNELEVPLGGAAGSSLPEPTNNTSISDYTCSRSRPNGSVRSRGHPAMVYCRIRRSHAPGTPVCGLRFGSTCPFAFCYIRQHTRVTRGNVRLPWNH